ncbi:MAG: vWA domain-containing protein [Alphaproteobacteria bacterium]
MADYLILRTTSSGHRLLGVHGQSVVEAHRQLATILASRLGADHAAYFARPQTDAQSSGIDWYATADVKPVPVAQLPPEQKSAVERRAAKLREDIAAFASQLRREGGSAELVGHMLDAALNVPPGDHLYAAGDQPITVMWGHEVQAATVPPRAVVPPRPAGPTRTSPHHQGTAALASPGLLGQAWWAWLLPLVLVLLLALFLLRSCEPLPPQTVDVPGPPAADPENPVPAEEARNKALQDELARLKGQQVCVPDPETKLPEKVEELPVTPPPRQEAKPVPPVKEKPKETPKPQEEAKPSPEPTPTPTPQEAKVVPVEKPGCRTQFPPGEEPEVIIVVDASGSMGMGGWFGGSSRMDRAKSSIDHVVRGLPDPITIGLIEFTNCNNVRRDKFYTSPQRPALLSEVNKLSPQQGTPLAGSIKRAGDIASQDAESVIVLVTDGDDSCGGDPCAEARAIKARKPKVKINIVDLSDGSQSSVLRCVANATGGQVLKPNSAMDMDKSLQRATGQSDIRECK